MPLLTCAARNVQKMAIQIRDNEESSDYIVEELAHDKTTEHTLIGVWFSQRLSTCNKGYDGPALSSGEIR